MYSLYKNAECVAYVSMTGPTNIPPLEALKIGTPLICSDIYEMKKQIGSDAAIFLNQKNFIEIQYAIEKILRNGFLKKKLIKNGKKRIETLSLEKFSKRFINIIEEIII